MKGQTCQLDQYQHPVHHQNRSNNGRWVAFPQNPVLSAVNKNINEEKCKLIVMLSYTETSNNAFCLTDRTLSLVADYGERTNKKHVTSSLLHIGSSVIF